MKILFVCHRLPYPPERGGKIRPFNMIHWLHDHGHEVTVVSIARSKQELEKGKGLYAFCHRYDAALISPLRGWLQAALFALSPLPSSLGYFYVPGLRERVRRILQNERFDMLWVHCSSVAQYVLDHDSCYRVMDFGDMDSEKWFRFARQRAFPLSLGYQMEGIKLRRYEERLARAFNCCTVVSRAEKRTLDTFGFPVSVTVIPNGVDIDYFNNPTGNYDPRTLIFLGQMDYYPNVDAVEYFCNAILPLIRRELPDVRLQIVGNSPNRRVRNLARIPGVEITGPVPDVRPYLIKAAVSIAPLRIACGIQNKVLESMAMRVPVVASSGAFDGITAVENEDLLVDDSPEGFASKVVALLNDPALRDRIADAGRRRIERSHTWPACLAVLSELLIESARSH
ncbi:MAG: TIGR03087 family PEP-CTERM/XrtA system glycosyltransferase [Acidobacteriia bacterium]|nr:TIGR03087 family PEP-CTERM/XrtA system glycosyltransferase [Terriglobia bacterium]